MNTQVIEAMTAAINKEFHSWESSSATWAGQRAVQSVAEKLAQVLHPESAGKRDEFLTACGVQRAA